MSPSPSMKRKEKMFEPSTKKGRRSGKKVSNAVRFTWAGSASTCPKSGLIVTSTVRSVVIPYFTSAPIVDEKSRAS